MSLEIKEKNTKNKEQKVESKKLSEDIKAEKITVKDALPRRHSALSLKSLTDELVSTKKKKEVKIDYNSLPSNSFTTARLQELWKQSIATYHKKGEKLLASLMSSCLPISEGNLLKIEAPNKLIKADLEKAKPKILGVIKKELQNFKIDFDISVNEKIEKKFAYTPQEKYAYLKDKNELITLLKTKFNLDV